MTQANAAFQKNIRHALRHLYHPEQLRQNPLIEWFGFSERTDAYSALQNTLIETIHALQPAHYEPTQSEARRTFEILLMRYIQRFSQEEVAHHIGFSVRQIRREQERAIDTLAEYLWKKFAPYTQAALSGNNTPAQPAQRAEESSWNLDAEWGWIKNTRSERISNTSQFINEITGLIQSVADQHQVRLNLNCPDSLPGLAMHPVAARQILLNVLRVAIAHASAGQITLDAAPDKTMLEVRVTSSPSAGAERDLLFDQERNLLEIASRLTELSHGKLFIEDQAEGFSARLLLPVVDGIPVLVVDDNHDIIDMIQRFTTGTRYNVSGLDDPDQIFAAIESSGARMILLDVMMPKVDGWELLSRLRQHPLTNHIPVIIFSILAQEELALSLGARALLVKPATQGQFLAVMDQVFSTLL